MATSPRSAAVAPDLTAIALAYALKADKCEIYTTSKACSPPIRVVVPDARKLQEISYDEMLELASAGSKVMQARSVEFAKNTASYLKSAPVSIKTQDHCERKKSSPWKSTHSRPWRPTRTRPKVIVSNIPDRPGSAAKVFRALAEANVMVDMIVPERRPQRHRPPHPSPCRGAIPHKARQVLLPVVGGHRRRPGDGFRGHRDPFGSWASA